MSNSEQATTKQSFQKMSSSVLLKKVSKGKMKIKEAKIAAKILDRRFPAPLESSVVNIKRKQTKKAA